MNKEKGFSLIEALVVILVIVLLGFILSDLLLRIFRGGNKTEIVGTVKQNGQAALGIMDSTIRSSQAVVCLGTWNSWPSLATQPNDTIAVVQKGVYIRFRFYPATSTANGYLAQDTPVVDPNSTASLCAASFLGGLAQASLTVLTDANTTTGVSISLPTSSSGFTRMQQPGFKDVVGINFTLNSGIQSGSSSDKQVSINSTNGINFSTTVEIR